MILGALTSHVPTIEVGASYRREGGGAFVETAYVLEVAPDRLGIPHVRFQLQVARGACRPTIETRTLSVEAFQSRFRDRIRERH
ncbi:MAG: hypothetical protein PHD48_02220 [Alphaproteobacteria bacterium]|nr:hypothetical protein [Alphaproteobacteria bacterium]